MATAVVILGAGASADFGAPVLRGVFRDPTVRSYLDENPWLTGQLSTVFWEPRGLDLSTASDGPSIEEMLTIFHEVEQYRNPAGPESADVTRFRRDLYALIFRALYTDKSSRPGHLNSLIRFTRQHFQRTTWASFNWDCLFESSFWYSSGDPNVPGDRKNPRVVIPLANWTNGPPESEFLKLHGGINWWMIRGVLTYFSFSGTGRLGPQWAKYERGEITDADPVILEPSYYKYEGPSFDHLKRQWDFFRSRLLHADCVLSIGYSLPDSDSLARSTVTTAFQLNEKAYWAVVDPAEPICDRYQCLLGKKRFRPFPVGLVGFNANLAANMADAFPNVPFE